MYIYAYLLLYASGAAAADNHLGFARTKAFSDALSHTHLQIINQLYNKYAREWAAISQRSLAVFAVLICGNGAAGKW
jgi:hypothetical protein